MTPEDLRTQVMDAICNSFALRDWCGGYRCKQCEREADVVIPLILEVAAKVADEYNGDGMYWDNAAVACNEISDMIRALKGTPDVQQA